MKTLIPIIITGSLLLSGGAAAQTRSADDGVEAEGFRRAQEEMRQAQTEMERAHEEVRIAQSELQRQVDDAARQVGDVLTTVAGVVPRELNRIHASIKRNSSAAPKSLVIRSTEVNQADYAFLEEDLAVMSRVLEKAIEDKFGDQRPQWTAMGINLFFGPGNDSPRSLYLEDYGALFLLSVNFPLLAPPSPSEPAKEQITDSTWEEARRELYGGPAEPKVLVRAAEEYDESKVADLKDALLEALKNASNIRGLKPDDAVTVTVFGGTVGVGTGTGKHVVSRVMPMNSEPLPPNAKVIEDPRRRQVMVFTDESHRHARGSVLTLRAKKSDVDAYAKGELGVDEFHKRVSILAYTGDPLEPRSTGSPWVRPPGRR